MTLEQLLQHKIDQLEPCEPIADADLEELDPSGLTPIEGVGLEKWAAITAGVMIGAKLEILLDDTAIDHARWRRVCEAWSARLACDGSMVIASCLQAALRRLTSRLARGSIPPARTSRW